MLGTWEFSRSGLFCNLEHHASNLLEHIEKMSFCLPNYGMLGKLMSVTTNHLRHITRKHCEILILLAFGVGFKFICSGTQLVSGVFQIPGQQIKDTIPVFKYLLNGNLTVPFIHSTCQTKW
jgi:hypothetical protein